MERRDKKKRRNNVIIKNVKVKKWKKREVMVDLLKKIKAVVAVEKINDRSKEERNGNVGGKANE